MKLKGSYRFRVAAMLFQVTKKYNLNKVACVLRYFPTVDIRTHEMKIVSLQAQTITHPPCWYYS